MVIKIIWELIFTIGAITELIFIAWNLNYPLSIGSAGLCEQKFFHTIFKH